ncbi:tumor necrosis factor receptor superfamily member 13B isoform X2 [Ctenopharyngodon idella]|uniref:tumor necrosis factor receptor superfamily member 13B isoform X2 n=1 Tax=Ctenopharyngodon idella TaxID=7959 RepID=UPI002231A6E7|nr:tumor necrosis factor receptor superfamily member 13B isoform X2 [Ctenopharyngodon idella]
MAQRCEEGQHLDRLLRKCVSCNLVCHDPVILTRCSEYCVAWRCKAVSGQFYDRLLKKCLKCSELCGSHPSACSDACGDAVPVAVTQRPLGVSAVPLITSRGRAVPRSSLYSEALLYSLLGLCIIVLMFTLTAAILLLLKRAKHQQQQLDTKKQQPKRQGQSSKDSLVARADDVSQEGSVNQDRPKATETCVYCFSDHTAAPHALSQQSGAQQASRAANPCNNGLLQHPLHTHPDKSRPFRIICSPTQTSM